MRQMLTVAERTDRFATALGIHLKNIDPADAHDRAVEIQADAYGLDPAEAAEIYALELAPEESDIPADMSTSSLRKVLGFVMDDITPAERVRALEAAAEVLTEAEVTPLQGAAAA